MIGRINKIFLLFTVVMFVLLSGIGLTREHLSSLEYVEKTEKLKNNITVTSFWGITNNQQVLCSMGYAYKKIYYENEGVVWEFYYVFNDSPTDCIDLYHGTLTVNDDARKLKNVIYLDQQNNPVKNRFGYAKVEYSLDENNRVKKECYFNESGEPVQSVLGQYGISYGRDSMGRIITISYLDKDGSVCENSIGFSSIRRIYSDGGYTDIYMNKDNESVKLSKGQYGIHYSRQHRYLLNKSGRPLLSIENILVFIPYVVIAVGVLLCILFAVLPKKLSILLLFTYIAFILYETLMFRETGDMRVNLHLFSYADKFFTDYSVRSEVINNIWLFVPFGAGVSVLVKKKWIYAVSFLFSLFIELIQLITSCGLCELNDIFGNTLGGIIGFMIVREMQRIKGELFVKKQTT